MDKKYLDVTGKIWIVKDSTDPERVILKNAEHPSQKESILKSVLKAGIRSKLITEVTHD